MKKNFLSFVFLLSGTIVSLQAQTLDGNFSSLGKEEVTATIQVTAIGGQPFVGVTRNDNLSYGFTELVALANEATELTGLTVDKKTASLETGSSLQLVASLLPEVTFKPSVYWHSSNPSVASVSEGLVRAMSAGTATITVTSAGGLLADACVVTVQAGSTTAIDLIESGNKVYPSVVRQNLFVDLQQPQTVYLINLSGQICATLQGHIGANVISMQSYPAGIYFVRLTKQAVKIIKR